MYSKLQSLCICFLFALTFSIGYAATDKNTSHSEIQVLIDVSGSMKSNDPKNLRIPALKLLINLLPDKIKTGIWLFAEKTTVLIKTGIVNSAWKKQALSKIQKIHSSGLFTHIEDSIEKSSQSWFKNPKEQPRHLILLTDGVVDISKDIMESAESRERILVDQVSQLQQAGVKVHTIALSESADTELLDKLAFDTNGWSETAQYAGQLQKVFFKIFQQAVPKDTTSIENNRFKIDSSINEFSVLIFKESNAQATQLLSPDNKKILSHSFPKNVSWLSEKNYDLVTIKNPTPGEWEIVAKMDPDNQVMIVTDLKFQVNEIPNQMTDQDSIDFSAYFSDKHQLISREDFLSLIEISIHQTSKSGANEAWTMQPDTDKAGLFRSALRPNTPKGEYTITIKADGKTFQREFVQSIKVVESFINVEKDINQKKRTVTVKLTPDINIVNTKMMSIQANITQPGKKIKYQELVQKNGIWEATFEKSDEGDTKIINFSVIAKSITGDSLTPNIKPIVINDSLFSNKTTESSKEKKSTKINNIASDEPTNDAKDAEDIEEEEESINWVKTSLIILAVNIVIAITGFFLFKFYKKRASDSQAQLLARLE